MSGRHAPIMRAAPFCLLFPRDPEAAGAGRLAETTVPRRRRSAGGGAEAWRVSGASGRARAWRRRRMRPAKAPRVTSCFAYLCLPLHSSLGLVASTSPSTLGTGVLSPFYFTYFSSHVTRGRPPPAAEVTGKLRLRPLRALGCGGRLEPFFLLWAACLL